MGSKLKENSVGTYFVDFFPGLYGQEKSLFWIWILLFRWLWPMT